MGLFDFMKGKKENVIAAPVKGECIPISEVADPTFAEEILGKGMAIKPTEGKFYAPADGTISTLFPTGHAIGLTTSEGVELLIHVGIDTVEMKGDGFKSHVKEGQRVKKGDLLLTMDLEKIKAAGHPATIMVAVTNSDDLACVETVASGQLKPGDQLMCLKA